MEQDAEQNTPCKEIEGYNPVVSLKTNNGSKTSWEFFGFDGMANITNVFAACDDKNPNKTNRSLSFTFDVLERNRFEQLGAVAEFERSLIKSRQTEGIAKAKERGVYQVRKKKIDDNKILELTAAGHSQNEVAALLGITRMSVYRCLNANRTAQPA